MFRCIDLLQSRQAERVEALRLIARLLWLYERSELREMGLGRSLAHSDFPANVLRSLAALVFCHKTSGKEEMDSLPT